MRIACLVVPILYKHVKYRLDVMKIAAKRQAEAAEIIQEADFSNNPYRKVHMRADAAKNRKQSSRCVGGHWTDNPLKIVDDEDLFYTDGQLRTYSGIMAIANEILSQKRGTAAILEDLLNGYLPGARDVERVVLVHLLRECLAQMSGSVTKAQIEAIILEREAMQLGKRPSTHIAQERGTSSQAALRLLKRARKAILVQNGEVDDIIKIEMRIKEHARTIPRYCSNCGNQCEDGLHALCKVCHARFVYRQEFLNQDHQREIEDSMRISSMTHWRLARQMVQQTQYT